MVATRATAFRSVVRVASGNFLEMYDFMVFGDYAAAIGKAFFPSGNAYLSLMLSLATFGAGFLTRPLRGDRAGRLCGPARSARGVAPDVEPDVPAIPGLWLSFVAACGLGAALLAKKSF